MKLFHTEIDGCMVVELDRHTDHRGYFQEFYQAEKYSFLPTDGHEVHSLARTWHQGNISVNKKNVVRGLHIAPYDKLVTCVHGAIFDVVVDFRTKSPTYLQWAGKWLSPADPEQLFVPQGCGHGFMSVHEQTVVVYLQNAVYATGIEESVLWNDKSLDIQWPSADPEYILSEKDENSPSLSEFIQSRK